MPRRPKVPRDTFPTVILAVCGSTGGTRDWSSPVLFPALHECLLYPVGRPNRHPLRTVGAWVR
eukprot:1978503-Pyramimonas_sp.AAC.1